MRLLITGGAGFIGSNLVRLATNEGLDVTVLDDLSTGDRRNLDGSSARFVEGSILDPGALTDALSGVSSVVHLAALGSVPRSVKDPIRSHEVNATGTLRVLQAAREAGAEHVVFSSSSSVYGANPVMPKVETAWVRPISPYGVAKLAAEQYVLAHQQSYGMPTLAFRFFNVYGPGQPAGHAYAAVIPVFLDALAQGRPLPVNGDGLHSRDFTYVGTVCRTLLEAVQRRVSHSTPVNLAFGTNTSLLQLIATLEDVVGRPVEVEHRVERVGDVRHSQADNGVLRGLFPGLHPVSLRDGLAATVEWFEGAYAKRLVADL